MTKQMTIECDGCGRDLTYTSNSVDYRLALIVERLLYTPGGGAVTDIGILNPLPSAPKHFCTLSCLLIWIEKLKGKQVGPADPTESE